MSDEEQPRATLEGILAKLGQTSYGELVHDEQRRRHLLATMMAESTDPVLREMGQQLRDGLVSPRQLVTVSDYWEALQRGFEKLAEVNLDEVAEQVDEIHRRETDRPDNDR